MRASHAVGANPNATNVATEGEVYGGGATSDGQPESYELPFSCGESIVEDNCPVCLEPLKDMVKETVCHHKICKACWEKWEKARVGRALFCPLCRQVQQPAPLQIRAFREGNFVMQEGEGGEFLLFLLIGSTEDNNQEPPLSPTHHSLSPLGSTEDDQEPPLF